MSDLQYVWEKYYRATIELAGGSDDLRTRVLSAYREHALHAQPHAATLPAHVADRVDQLHRRMSQRPDPDGSGTLAASVQLMDEDELQSVAKEMAYIAFATQEEIWRARVKQ